MSAALDPIHEELFLGIAYALFMNRLHVLRLTEVVRFGIQPNPDDQDLVVPEALDDELKQQAVAYVEKCFPEHFKHKLDMLTATWLALS
jgi:hypothetical protein